MTKPDFPDINPDRIVDQLYDIALNPETLDTFIEAWNAAGLETCEARKTIRTIDAFDEIYLAHLNRAETFLARGAILDTGPDLAAILSPFEDLVAFIIDENLQVVASNAGAKKVFGITDHVDISTLHLPYNMQETLTATMTHVFRELDQPDRLLRLQFPGERGPALFQIRALPNGTSSKPQHALVVTTQYHWQAALGGTLEDVFKLTGAEQGVVRALVEGMDAKAIALERGTSEGTVRGQIKSILSKMNARSQSEVIRLVLSLRDVSQSAPATPESSALATQGRTPDWLENEVWKPFKTLILPDGRKMDYHEMGPANGAPILFSHMGYGLARWHHPMVKLAFHLGLRVIVPIRPGFGQSDNLHPKADVLESMRNDTCALLQHLHIEKLPYGCQGNDLMFATDFAGHFPHKITEIAGVAARPCLSGDLHYSGMGKWHRFFLSTAKHAPHLLHFTAKAAVAMAKRIGPREMFRQMHKNSPADLAVLEDETLSQVLLANAELIAGKTTNVAQIYAMDLLVTEADWSHILIKAKETKTWFVNGDQDPSVDLATIAQYRETYPWIDIEVIPNAGQLMIFQEYNTIIPKLAAAAKAAQQSQV